jgi:hypothetical protein
MDRFDPGRLGDWIAFCDICGRKCYASETTKLASNTGKGGLVVCKYDVDKIDYGLVPYRVPVEKSPPSVRTNHTNTDDGSPTVDLESMTYNYYLASSQDGAIILSSQDDAIIISSAPI